MYKEINVEVGNGITEKHIVRDNGGGHFTSFPANAENPNYQAYLKWVAEGNTPEPADEPSA
jgi:hypothetical protein